MSIRCGKFEDIQFLLRDVLYTVDMSVYRETLLESSLLVDFKEPFYSNNLATPVMCYVVAVPNEVADDVTKLVCILKESLEKAFLDD